MIHKVLPWFWKWCKQGEQLEDSRGMLMRDHHGGVNIWRLGRRGLIQPQVLESIPLAELTCSTEAELSSPVGHQT